MIVPAYWAEGRARERRGGRQVGVRRWGWSDEGQAQAQAHADERARAALQRVLAGEALPRREKKVPYNGADGLPIREEIVSRHGEVVVTRNSYGALCLNTPDVLFADVDFGDPPLSCKALAAAALLGAIGGAAYLDGHRALGGTAGGVGALVLLAILWKLVNLLAEAVAGGREAQARSRVRRFVERRPGWKARVYRTPAGLRALVLHARFEPGAEEVAAFFRALRSDPIYVRMCVRQRCFRARVSPKPWRIGVEGHLKPRPGVWPVAPERREARDRWIAEYERAARGFAACRFLEEVGDGPKDPVADELRALHDELSRALTSLPIA